LLRQFDGRTVNVSGQEVKLQLAGAPVQDVPLTPVERFFVTIINPTIAAILLTLGINGLLFELSNPTGYVAGIVGGICLLLAFYALGVLNANWVGLGFIALAFVLFIVDVKAPTHGALTAGGLASFVLGAFLLFDTSGLQVPWAAIIGSALGTAGFFMFAIAKALAAQKRRPATGMEGMIGQTAQVRRQLAPVGTVLVEGELWQAEAEDGSDPVPVGERVIVTGHEGFRLHVQRVMMDVPLI
jgi:membrane-bound serine protease (ClpP class)